MLANPHGFEKVVCYSDVVGITPMLAPRMDVGLNGVTYTFGVVRPLQGMSALMDDAVSRLIGQRRTAGDFDQRGCGRTSF